VQILPNQPADRSDPACERTLSSDIRLVEPFWAHEDSTSSCDGSPSWLGSARGTPLSTSRKVPEATRRAAGPHALTNLRRQQKAIATVGRSEPIRVRPGSPW